MLGKKFWYGLLTCMLLLGLCAPVAQASASTDARKVIAVNGNRVLLDDNSVWDMSAYPRSVQSLEATERPDSSVELRDIPDLLWISSDNNLYNLQSKMKNFSNVKKAFADGYADTKNPTYFYLVLENDGSLWVESGNPTQAYPDIPYSANRNIANHVKDIFRSNDLSVGGFYGIVYDDGTVQVLEISASQKAIKLVDVPELTHVVSMTANLALKDDGTVWTWQDAASETARTAHEYYDFHPALTQVSGLSHVVQIASSLNKESNFALTADGTLYSWGSNQDDELGYGTESDVVTVPTKVPGLPPIRAVASYNMNTEAIGQDGTLWVFGLFGGRPPVSVPTQVVFPPSPDQAPPAPPTTDPRAITDTPVYVRLIINGNEVRFTDALPFVNADGRVMVPLRMIADTLNAQVGWNADQQLVTLQLNGKSIQLHINEKKALVNGTETDLDSPATLKDERTMVPLRFVAETFGGTVSWDGTNQIAAIDTVPKAPASQYDAFGRLIRTTNLPKNADQYPYVLANLPNAAYEFDKSKSWYDNHSNDALNAKQMYTNSPYVKVTPLNVNHWADTIINHYNLLFNVDYRTIDDSWIDKYYDEMGGSTSEYLKTGDLKKFVDWVKANHVITKGFAQPERSMVYFNGDGVVYMRTYLHFQIVSADSTAYLKVSDQFHRTDNSTSTWNYSGYFDVPLVSEMAMYGSMPMSDMEDEWSTGLKVGHQDDVLSSPWKDDLMGIGLVPKP